MKNGILNQEYSHMLANSIDHKMTIQHEEELNYIIMKQEMHYMHVFNLKPVKEGNQWMVLLGENIQEGICGFGETPLKAVLDFNKNFIHEKIEKA
jgi:hypothetical protein